ncbi:hypothetical protein [Heyndrickxia ginsengihumi]
MEKVNKRTLSDFVYGDQFKIKAYLNYLFNQLNNRAQKQVDNLVYPNK